MTHWLARTLVAAVVATTASACTLYFGDDTGDDDCLFDGAAEAAGLRNPQTNQCEFIGGGGGGCGAQPTPAFDQAGAPAPVDWAQCFTSCEGLDEQSCFAAPECRATYTQTDPSQGGFRFFSGCVGIAPSGPVTGEACQGLDGYGCSRHNDCVAIYGSTDLPNDGYSGSGVFTSCEPEPGTQGCFATADCPTGYTCTTEQGVCDPPPGCDPSTGMACPAVCFGQCVPAGGSCAAIDCGPGFHCEELCTGGGPAGGAESDSPIPPGTCTATCVPDQQMCPIECPPDSACVEVCPPCGYPGDPSCGQPCHFECQGVPPSTCTGFDCGPDAHCEERCFPCDPLPDGSGCEVPVCEPFCVPDPTTECGPDTCMPGSHCEIQCTPVDPNNPMGPMGGCTATCVPDPGQGCAAIDCGPGTHCEETCAGPPCGDPAGCPDVCRGECVPDGPGQCNGVVICALPPPACPIGTTAGVAGGCWSGYCIPDSQCGDPPPATCEDVTDEMTCRSRVECAPIYTGVCTPNPDGTWTCVDTVFTRCESRVMPLPG
ncbi:MAG: hypothetical protein JNK64_34945 [Myxococcales bacterium]|nr:hypothetical protein [Myxococcales bacterium]